MTVEETKSWAEWDDVRGRPMVCTPAGVRVGDLLESNGYRWVDVDNAGVDGYFVDPQYWSEELREKALRLHPLGSWGC